MSRIFISYRRADGDYVTELCRKMKDKFGDEQVFMDTLDIPTGGRWPGYLEDKLRQANVVLALIGRNWNSPRLRDSHDWVRIELETALFLSRHEECHVIPIMVGGAKVPKRTELPSAIRELSDLQGCTIRQAAGFDSSVKDLFSRLGPFFTSEDKAHPAHRTINYDINVNATCERYGGRVSQLELPSDARIFLKKRGRWEVSIQVPSDPSRNSSIWCDRGPLESPKLPLEEAAGVVIECFSVTPDRVLVWRPKPSAISFLAGKEKGEFVQVQNPVFTHLGDLILYFDQRLAARMGGGEPVYYCNDVPREHGRVGPDHRIMGHPQRADTFGEYLFSLTREPGGRCQSSGEFFFCPTWPHTRLRYLIPTQAPWPDVQCCAHVGKDDLGYHLAFCE